MHPHCSTQGVFERLGEPLTAVLPSGYDPQPLGSAERQANISVCIRQVLYNSENLSSKTGLTGAEWWPRMKERYHARDADSSKGRDVLFYRL